MRLTITVLSLASIVGSMNLMPLLPSAIAGDAATNAAETRQPNVLFIMADDLRAELGSYGSIAKTPHLNRLATRSVQFQRAYCQQAVCNPSRSSLLTGRRPDSLNLWNNGTHFREHNPDVTTLPLWFKSHGYDTRCVGKIFHNWHTTEKGDRRSWSTDEFLHYANHGDDTAKVEGDLPPNTLGEPSRLYGKVPLCECRDVPDEAYYDGRVANEAIRVMNELRDRPFFLAVGFWKPHAPFNAPKKYWDLYERKQFERVDASRPEGTPDLAYHDGREIRGVPPNQITFTPEQIAMNRHGYFANISYFDAQLGKVMNELDRLGLSKNTIVTFISDHGYHLGEHDLWGKTSNFERDAHVPMFISTPGMSTAGQRCDAIVELIDLFPTLTDVCRLPAPKQIEGISLATQLKDVSARGKEGAFTQHPRPAYFDREPSRQPTSMGYSVRTAAVRYTEWRDWQSGDIVGRELYDSNADRIEARNEVDSPRFSQAQRTAERLLRRQFPKIEHRQ